MSDSRELRQALEEAQAKAREEEKLRREAEGRAAASLHEINALRAKLAAAESASQLARRETEAAQMEVRRLESLSPAPWVKGAAALVFILLLLARWYFTQS